jgi:hypothetical protein
VGYREASRKILPLAVFLLTFVAFVPALDGQFVNWDDDRNFLTNQSYRGLGWTHLKWMWTSTLLGHYIPLTWMTLGLNYVVGGMDPWGYHLGNLLIHSANSVVFYFLVRRLLTTHGEGAAASTRWGAAFAALVFGIHPLRVESVAWVTERRDLLCGFFFLLTVLTYLRSVEPDARAARWRALSLALFVAALLSKAQALPLPMALLLLDVYPLRRVHSLGWRRVLVEKVPYAVIALALTPLVLLAVKHGSGFTDLQHYGPAARLAMTAYGIVFYPWKWLWPVGLSPLYELPARVELLAPRFLLPLPILVVVSGLLVALRHRWPAGLAAWLYSALMVLPNVGLVHTGRQLVTDRYSYLSGLGFALLVGAALVWVIRSGERHVVRSSLVRVCTAGALLVLFGLGSAAWIQASGWKDSETLWAWAVEQDPQCAACLSNFGEAIGRDRPGDAETAFAQSLAMREQPAARNNLGAVLELQGRVEEAEAAYRQALATDADFPEALVNLGVLYAKLGRDTEALPLLRRAFRVDPEFPRLRGHLSGVLHRRAARLMDERQQVAARALVEEARAIAPAR